MGTNTTTSAQAESATSNKDTDNKPPTPRKIVGRQAGFALAFIIGINIMDGLIVWLASLLMNGSSDSLSVMAWSQLLTDPLPVLLIFAVAQSKRKEDNAITGEGTPLHLQLRSRTKMTVSVAIILVLMLLVLGGADDGINQLLTSGADVLHLKMHTTNSQIIDITDSAVGILGVCLVNPICEEIIFRGTIMENLRQYGPIFAITTSSLLFGAMHGDLLQGISAFLSGLLMGYVAYRYSLAWSIALHILNNIIATLEAHGPWPGLTTWLDTFGAVACVVLLVLAVVQRRAIGTALHSHRPPEHIWRAWRSPLFIATLVLCVFEAINRFLH